MLKKPIVLTFTMLASPRYEILDDLDKEEDIYRRIGNAEANAFSQLNGLVFDPPQNGKASQPTSIKISVEEPSSRDREYIAKHASYPESYEKCTAIRFSAEWLEPQAVSDECRASGRKHDREVVTRVCGGALEDMARKISIGLSLYSPGISTSFYSYIFPFDSMKDLNFACYSRFDAATVFLARHQLGD